MSLSYDRFARAMPATPRYVVHTGSEAGHVREVGMLFELPSHGQVCLHTEDPEVVRRLEGRGLLNTLRPPFLDATEGGIHGHYRPLPQLNVFLAPPIEAVAEALRAAGYVVEEAAEPSAP